MPLIGSHATVTGGLATGGLSYAAEVGAEVIQVFVSSPRGWAAGPGDATEDARLRESGIAVFVHATYLANLGSGNAEVAGRSADAIAHALRRGAEIGARGVVVHAGPFRELLAALPDVPFVVETPGGKAGHARDIATLKGLR